MRAVATLLALCSITNAGCFEPPAVDCGDIYVGVHDAGACRYGSADCNNNAADGCETSILTDTANCGGCGLVCGDARTIAVCQDGQCLITGCRVPYTVCGPELGGCPINLLKDSSNCGACGLVCDVDAGEACDQGTCGVPDAGP